MFFRPTQKFKAFFLFKIVLVVYFHLEETKALSFTKPIWSQQKLELFVYINLKVHQKRKLDWKTDAELDYSPTFWRSWKESEDLFPN